MGGIFIFFLVFSGREIRNPTEKKAVALCLFFKRHQFAFLNDFRPHSGEMYIRHLFSLGQFIIRDYDQNNIGFIRYKLSGVIFPNMDVS